MNPADDRPAMILKDSSWDEEGWTRIPNAVVRDENLSWEAKGLIAYMASHSTKFEVSVATLMRVGGSGRDRTRKILKELQDAGYLSRRQLRSPDERRLGPVEYTLQTRRSDQAPEKPSPETCQETEKPSPELQWPGSQATDPQAPGCQPPENTTPYKKNNSKKTIFKEDQTSGGAELALADTDGSMWLIRGEPVEITAQACVAAWVDEIRQNGTEPTKAQIGRVARTCKELLAGNDGTRVLQAARDAGSHGNAAVDSAMTIAAGRPFAPRKQTKSERLSAVLRHADDLERHSMKELF